MRRFTRALGAGLALALVLTACNGDEPDPTTEVDEVDPADEVDEVEPDEEVDEVDDEPGVSGPYRLGWALAYLSAEYAMSDLYTCTGGSNYFGYCNEEFDQALSTANAADPEEANALYQQAEDILLEDLPLIPMWYGQSTSVFTERVSNVVIDATTYLRVELLEVDGGPGGEVTVYGCEPQSLVPQDSREVCGGRVVHQVFSGLAEINAETGEPELVMAESIETDDSINWTITIRDDFTFHDGTPVTAQSFVDAWNFGANPENAMRGAGFFADIEGYQAVADGEADTLSGVEVVDDTTIEVTLSQPFAPFLTKLSDSVFYPLPEVAYDDIDAFNQAPIGNGRFMMDGEWEREQQIAIQRYEDWPGDNPAGPDHVTYLIFTGDAAVQTAYLEVQGGALDVLESIPPEMEVQVDDDFGDRVVRTPTSSFTYLGFPMYRDEFQDINLRRALSLAINREAIISAIFNDTLRPATAVIPPVLEEVHRPDACAYCVHDPDQAQQLFEEAGGWDGTMTVSFNSGAGHDEWVESVTDQWRDTLGIQDFRFESLEFAEYLEVLDVTG